ncbi:DUF732 domain-containing protein [Mycobacterium sp. MAA66]|uniref:DUF732 domain-containing protein n=1 Tax=Mycobacterium sp. MAA66 TaxID=3156297 RepID=UPI00351690B5
MLRLKIASVPVGVLAAALLVTPLAAANTDDDDTLMDLLSRDGISTSTVAHAREAALAICSALQDGDSSDRLTTLVLQKNSTLTRDQAQAMILDSEVAYCPGADDGR